MNIEIINEVVKDRDYSIYATSDLLDEFICSNNIKLENLQADGGDICILDDYDHAILSKFTVGNKDFWVLEELIKDDGKQYTIETDLLIVEESILELVDLDKVECNETIILGSNEEDEEDELDSYFDDLIEDFMNELEDEDACFCCKLKELIRDVYSTARKDLVVELLEKIN